MSAGARILYVEDDTGLAGLVRARLEAVGYGVETCASGAEARAAFDPALHDLVMVDYQLPDGDGLQLLEEISARGTTPVIIVTGAGSEEVAVRAMKLGAADYINKEVTGKFFHLLPSVIEKTIRQHELAMQSRRAQAQLRESEERLRSILASIDDAVIVTDRAGLFVAVRASDTGGGLPGRLSTGYIGATFREVFPTPVAGLFENAFAAVQENDEVVQFDYSLPAEGSEAWFNAKVSPLRDPNGSFAGVTIVARDVTARRLSEERLRLASLAADAASRAKSELLAGMSHELRTPLTAIIGYAEILSNEYFGSINERQKQQLQIILQASRHLLDLINDILDISRVESGKTELEIGPVRMGALVEQTLPLVKETASRNGIEILTSIPPDVAALAVPADERRIRQVLSNLLSNSLKFTPAGGRVEIAVRRRPDYLATSVTDTGIGIPPDELEQLFDAFYQVRGRPVPNGAPGSGLGLSLARQIVELHGGRIWAESEGDGKGSRLTFTLPLRRPAR